MFIYQSVSRVLLKNKLTFINVVTVAGGISKGRVAITRISNVKVVSRLFRGVFSFGMFGLWNHGGGSRGQRNGRAGKGPSNCPELTFCKQEGICYRYNRLLCFVDFCKLGRHICKRCWAVDGSIEHHGSDDKAQCKNMSLDYMSSLDNGGTGDEAMDYSNPGSEYENQEENERRSRGRDDRERSSLGRNDRSNWERERICRGRDENRNYDTDERRDIISREQTNSQPVQPLDLTTASLQRSQFDQSVDNIRPAPPTSCPPSLTAQNVSAGFQAATSANVRQSVRPSSYHSSTESMHQRGDDPRMAAANHGGNLSHNNTQQHGPRSALHQAGDVNDPLGFKIQSEAYQHSHTPAQGLSEIQPSWRPNYEKLHETFGSQGEKNKSLKKPKSSINQHKLVTQNPADVDEGVLFRKFLEKERESLQAELKKERAENDILRNENLQLRQQLEKYKAREEVDHGKLKGRMMQPYSRLNLINLPSDFDAPRQPAHAQSNQATNQVPSLGVVKVPPLFNKKPQSPPGAGPSLDPGQFPLDEVELSELTHDIYHLYNPEYANLYNPEYANFKPDIPERDLRSEIRQERRSGIVKKSLFDL